MCNNGRPGYLAFTKRDDLEAGRADVYTYTVHNTPGIIKYITFFIRFSQGARAIVHIKIAIGLFVNIAHVWYEELRSTGPGYMISHMRTLTAIKLVNKRCTGFVKDSFRRAFSTKRAAVFYVLLVCVCALLIAGVISDRFTRDYRLIFAGSIFVICLTSSIVHGVPAALLTVLVNLLGVSFTMRDFHTTGDWYYLSISVFQITTAISSVIIAVLAEMEKAKRESHEQASLTDALTEVYNTRFFHLRLDEEITRSIRKSDPMTLLLIDVNAFKSINDNYGHLEGDKVLKDIALYLRKSTRASDVVCRSGGDEFAVILPDTDKDAGNYIAQRIAAGASGYILKSQNNGLSIPVFISVGAATFPHDAEERPALIDCADKRLYKEKRKFYSNRETVAE